MSERREEASEQYRAEAEETGKPIEMHNEEVDLAEPGDEIGFNARGAGRGDARRGGPCGPADGVVESGDVGKVTVRPRDRAPRSVEPSGSILT